MQVNRVLVKLSLLHSWGEAPPAHARARTRSRATVYAVDVYAHGGALYIPSERASVGRVRERARERERGRERERVREREKESVRA